MRWVISATIIAMLFSFAFVPPPVLAAGAGDIESVEEEFDCAVEIESVEEEIESGSVSKAAEADVRAARNMVKKAKAALAEGKKKCENLIKKAQDTLGNS